MKSETFKEQFHQLVTSSNFSENMSTKFKRTKKQDRSSTLLTERMGRIASKNLSKRSSFADISQTAKNVKLN